MSRLSQYAYAAMCPEQRAEFWQNATYDGKTMTWKSTVEEPVKLAFWCKHRHLHSWMEHTWHQKMLANNLEITKSQWRSSFTGVILELTNDDLSRLNDTIINQKLDTFGISRPGDNTSSYYRRQDLAFIADATQSIQSGFRVFYCATQGGLTESVADSGENL